MHAEIPEMPCLVRDAPAVDHWPSIIQEKLLLPTQRGQHARARAPIPEVKFFCAHCARTAQGLHASVPTPYGTLGNGVCVDEQGV